jgi:sialic acid synthase SpsE
VPDANLRWIGDLLALHPLVGYSDHTTDALAGAIAVACGACILEKHITYDRSASGPDHQASADPAQFMEYVRSVRLAATLLGGVGKRVLDCERDVRQVSRQSLVALRDIAPGALIGRDDLTAQRPGTGISAWEIDQVVGARASHSIPAGTMLNWDHLIPRQQAA